MKLKKMLKIILVLIILLILSGVGLYYYLVYFRKGLYVNNEDFPFDSRVENGKLLCRFFSASSTRGIKEVIYSKEGNSYYVVEYEKPYIFGKKTDANYYLEIPLEKGINKIYYKNKDGSTKFRKDIEIK